MPIQPPDKARSRAREGAPHARSRRTTLRGIRPPCDPANRRSRPADRARWRACRPRRPDRAGPGGAPSVRQTPRAVLHPARLLRHVERAGGPLLVRPPWSPTTASTSGCAPPPIPERPQRRPAALRSRPPARQGLRSPPPLAPRLRRLARATPALTARDERPAAPRRRWDLRPRSARPERALLWHVRANQSSDQPSVARP